jgi:hypothetical protein
MKNFKVFLLLISFVSVIISCSDTTDEDLGITAEGSFSAKVDGVTFTSLKVAVGATVTNGIAAIQGSNSGGDYIRLNIMNYTGIGTYKTGNSLTNVNSISYGTIDPIATWVSTFNIGDGTIEITGDTSTTITGTFSFTGISDGKTNKTVTEGKFSAPKK